MTYIRSRQFVKVQMGLPQLSESPIVRHQYRHEPNTSDSEEKRRVRRLATSARHPMLTTKKLQMYYRWTIEDTIVGERDDMKYGSKGEQLLTNEDENTVGTPDSTLWGLNATRS
jgi:hypothetical protein